MTFSKKVSDESAAIAEAVSTDIARFSGISHPVIKHTDVKIESKIVDNHIQHIVILPEFNMGGA